MMKSNSLTAVERILLLAETESRLARLREMQVLLKEHLGFKSVDLAYLEEGSLRWADRKPSALDPSQTAIAYKHAFSGSIELLQSGDADAFSPDSKQRARYIIPIKTDRILDAVLIGMGGTRLSALKKRQLFLFQEIASALHSLSELRTSSSREQREAWIVQSAYLPHSLPQFERLQYACRIRPAKSIGGDYYDAIAIDSDKLALVIGDVSGKGPSAALVMANFVGYLRSQIFECGDNLTQLFSSLHKQLRESGTVGMYMSLFVGIIDTSSRRIRYVSAGHQPAVLLIEPSGEAVELTDGGPPLGLPLKSVSYDVGTAFVSSGCYLVAATDGLTDGENINGSEFGASRFQKACIAFVRAGENPNEFADRLIEKLDTFSSHMAQADDITLMVVRIH